MGNWGEKSLLIGLFYSAYNCLKVSNGNKTLTTWTMKYWLVYRDPDFMA